MRRFRFRLARLLRLSAQVERQSRMVLAVATQELAALDATIVEIEASLGACEPDQVAPGGLAGLARALHGGFAARLTACRGQREAQAGRVSALRAAFVAKRREHETLARLRRRQHTEWVAGVARDEQTELDELARLASATRRTAEEARS